MSVDGTWTLTINSPMGAVPAKLILKSSGASLTGTQSAQGQSGEIKEGKIEGNTLSWKNAITSPMPMTLEFSATVDGNKMAGKVSAGMMGKFDFTGERA
jgi:hypothetical protein